MPTQQAAISHIQHNESMDSYSDVITVCTDTSADYASPVEDDAMSEDDEKSFSGLVEDD